MGEAAGRLDREIGAKQRARLNEVTESVFASCAGQPVEVVLAALIKRSAAHHYRPSAQDLRPAAEAISHGRRFAYI